jgi:CBS domain-containing protein
MQLYAQHIMSKDLITVRPETLCEEAADLLVRHKISGAPVVDCHGNLAGVISLKDILKNSLGYSNIDTCLSTTQDIENILAAEGFHIELVSGGYVSDFMTRQVYTGYPHSKVEDIAKLMVEHHVHRIIILKAPTRKPIGIVTTYDLLRLIAAGDTLEHDLNKCCDWYSQKFSQIRYETIPTLQ